jgi:hypothetical protein
MKKTFAVCLLVFSTPALFAETAVTTVLPASGFTTGGDFVHIRGNQLTGAPLACPGMSCSNYVKFGDAVARIAVNTNSEIVAIAPAHASGTVDLTVNIAGAGNPIVLTNAYRYQNPPDDQLERILLPVAASGPGANTARFETEVSVTNFSDETVSVTGAVVPQGLLISPIPIPTLPPHTTGTFTDRVFNIPGHPGAFIYVPARVARDVVVKARVHDTSRDGAGFGVEIPAVSDREFTATVRLTGIPTDARSRSTLRVYAYDARNFGPVTVRVRDDADGTLLATIPVSLDGVPADEDVILPASAQLSLDRFVEPLRDHARLRIEIMSADSARPIWGFVSITNNQTQEITLVMPQTSGVAVAPDKIPSGWWAGGSLISVDDTDSKLYFGCYFGMFKTPSLDGDGRFKTTGLVFGGAGPPPLGGDHGTAMDFEGRVADGWLTLTIHSGSRLFATIRGQFVGPQQPGPITPPCP